MATRGKKLPREVLERVRRIQIVAGRRVDEAFAGQFRSVFRGSGIEFDEVREYVVGDDVRSIDWNVTARANKPFVKRYVEERERRLILVVDVSASQSFGTAPDAHDVAMPVLKAELAAEVAAVLAAAATRSHDKVGLIAFTDRVEHFVPARKGTRHAGRVIRDVLGFRPVRTGTDLAGTLDQLNRTLRRGAILVVISDFLAAGFEKPLERACRRHDVIAVRPIDAREEELPDVGLLRVEDLETGATDEIDTSSDDVRRNWADRAATRRADLAALMRRAGADLVHVRTGEDYVEPLRRLFRKRTLRRRRRAPAGAGTGSAASARRPGAKT